MKLKYGQILMVDSIVNLITFSMLMLNEKENQRKINFRKYLFLDIEQMYIIS